MWIWGKDRVLSGEVKQISKLILFYLNCEIYDYLFITTAIKYIIARVF